MKKVIFTVALLLMLGVNNSSSFSQVTRNGNTFTVASKMKQAASTKTRFTWQDSKGVLYPIYLSPSGATYVLKTSKKSGREYKYYLGEEISKTICKECNVEYKSSKRTKK